MQERHESNQVPQARVHDAGPLTVVNEDHGRIHHRHAAVVIFDNEAELKDWIKAGHCQLIPAEDLPADIREAMRNG